MIITNSLGSNYTREDRLLALKLLLQPWKWRDGDAVKQIATSSLDALGLPRNDTTIQLFLKGRHAILEALKVANVGPGDDVIVQAFTCLAVVQPILETGAKPVYIDVKKKSLNPTLSSIKAITTRQTKVLILQHTLGFVNPETKEIALWCKEHHIFLIQDLAHAFGAHGFKRFNLAAARLNLHTCCILSFSQDKVVDGVSGGALILIAGDAQRGAPSSAWTESPKEAVGWGCVAAGPALIKMLLYPMLTHLIRSTYKWKLGKLLHFIVRELNLLPAAIEVSDTGQYKPLSPSPMPNACAALALRQLERIDEIAVHRKDIALQYEKVLRNSLRIVSKSDILSGSNLRYPIWVNNRDELEEKLKKHNFYLLDHWYDSPIAPPTVDSKALSYRTGSCPNAEELSKHIFNLPTHVNISIEKATKLAELINQYAH